MAQRFDDSRSGGDNRNQGRGGDRHGGDRRRRDDAPRNRSGARDYRSEGQRGHYRNNDEHSHDRRHDGERYGERSNSPYGERRDGGRNWRDGERRDERPRREGDRRDERPRRDGERSDFRRGQGRGGNRNGRFDRDRLRGERRNSRPPQRNRVPEPELPEDVSAKDLDSTARMGLRALSRLNAENIARHLVMTQRLLETDPEVAYAHARYAASHAGRIAIVREAAGIAAYVAGLYSEALRELRAARRLSGMDTMYRAMEVDCERALGRPDAALRSAQNALQLDLEDDERAELAIVVTGIYHDQGNDELALITIEDAIRKAPKDTETLRRLHSVRADRLEDLGRVREAEAIRERIYVPEEPEVELYDIEEESAPELAEIARQLEEQSQAEAAERRREAEKLEAARQSAAGAEVGAATEGIEGADGAAAESEPEATEAADSAEGDGVDPIAAEVEDVIEGRSK